MSERAFDAHISQLAVAKPVLILCCLRFASFAFSRFLLCVARSLLFSSLLNSPCLVSLMAIAHKQQSNFVRFFWPQNWPEQRKFPTTLLLSHYTPRIQSNPIQIRQISTPAKQLHWPECVAFRAPEIQYNLPDFPHFFALIRGHSLAAATLALLFALRNLERVEFWPQVDMRVDLVITLSARSH